MTRRRFNLTERRRIIDEAYSKPDNIRATARLYDIYPSQIRRWRRALREGHARGVDLARSQARVILSPREPVEKDVDPDDYRRLGEQNH